MSAAGWGPPRGREVHWFNERGDTACGDPVKFNGDRAAPTEINIEPSVPDPRQESDPMTDSNRPEVGSIWSAIWDGDRHHLAEIIIGPPGDPDVWCRYIGSTTIPFEAVASHPADEFATMFVPGAGAWTDDIPPGSMWRLDGSANPEVSFIVDRVEDDMVYLGSRGLAIPVVEFRAGYRYVSAVPVPVPIVGSSWVAVNDDSLARVTESKGGWVAYRTNTDSAGILPLDEWHTNWMIPSPTAGFLVIPDDLLDCSGERLRRIAREVVDETTEEGRVLLLAADRLDRLDRRETDRFNETLSAMLDEPITDPGDVPSVVTFPWPLAPDRFDTVAVFADRTVPVPTWEDLGFKVVINDDHYERGGWMYDSLAEFAADPDTEPDDGWHWYRFAPPIKYTPSDAILWGAERHGVGQHVTDVEARWRVFVLHGLPEADT